MSRAFQRWASATLRGVLLWPVAGILAVIGVRFALVSNPGRIGHLASEVDYFLKETELGLVPKGRTVLLVNRRRAANRALLDVYRQYLPVWDHPLVCLICNELAKFPGLRLALGRPVLGFGEACRLTNMSGLWGDRPPAVQLTPQIEADGRACLRQMGIPDDAWFVALHVREEGYAHGDDAHHTHRNANVLSYGPAIRAITDAGGWVVRVGDPSMTPLPEMEQVVDYAVSNRKSEWMDLWLCAKCRFFIGTTSGLYLVAHMFGRRSVLANMVPMGAALSIGADDISIAKRYVRDSDALPFAEIFETGLSAQRYAFVFEEHRVALEPNSPKEIRDAVVEMMERTDGQFTASPDDVELQRRFRSLHRPIDYCYGSLSDMGRGWLRANRHLLED